MREKSFLAHKAKIYNSRSFRPWALLKGTKRSFGVVVVVLLLLLLGVETWVKNGTNGTKKFASKICSKSNKKCSKGNLKSWFQTETKSLVDVFLAICGHVRPSMSLNDLLWSCMAFHGLLGSYLSFFIVLSGLFIVLYGLFMSFMALYCLFSRS